MENMTRVRKQNNKHTCMINSHTPSSLSMHKDSHMVSKTRPKIRIIHIFAPEIIKTDVENFRELVQKLTGKPSGENCCRKKKRVIVEKRGHESSRSSGNSITSDDHNNAVMMTMKNNNINGGCWGLDVTRDKVKEEVGFVCCSDETSSSGGYLGGFSDLEGFISEIGGFPLDSNNHMMQGFEESQLL